VSVQLSTILQNNAIVLLVFLSVFLIIVALPGVLNTGLVGEYRLGRLQQIEQMHKDLFISDQSPREQLMWLEWGCLTSAVVVYFFTRSVLLALLVAILLWQIPTVVFWYLSAQRRQKFDEQLPVALDQLTSATKAGLTLSQALQEVSVYAPYPISQEFAQISADQELGIDLSTALKSARARVKSKTFNLVTTAMLVNIELGGNLPAAMEVMSGSLKEIWRLEQKLHTASSEGRKGGVILCVMPLVILAMVIVMQPDLLSTLLSSVVGYIVLFVAVVFYLGGLLWMYRILQVDI